MPLLTSDITVIRMNIKNSSDEQLRELRKIINDEVTNRSKRLFDKLTENESLTDVERCNIQTTCLARSLTNLSWEKSKADHRMVKLQEEQLTKLGFHPAMRNNVCGVIATRISNAIRDVDFSIAPQN